MLTGPNPNHCNPSRIPPPAVPQAGQFDLATASLKPTPLNEFSGSAEKGGETAQMHTPWPALAQHFERAPEHLFGSIIPDVIIASTGVRERTVKDLKIFRIKDLFAGDHEVFLGFGIPNVYLTLPNGEGGYQKFAAHSLKRAPSRIENTRGWVQSGIVLHLLDLPERAIDALRSAGKAYDGQRFWTCVNANCRVLDKAGFTTGGKALKDYYFPVSLLRTLQKNGLEYQGVPIRFQFIRTSPEFVETHALAIIKAELLILHRHGLRPLLEKLGLRDLWKKISTKRIEFSPEKPVASAMMDDASHCHDIRVEVSRPARFAMVLRWLWGPHTLFTASQDRVCLSGYLPDSLKEFPQPKPGLVTQLKKRVLFSKPVVALISKVLRPEFQSIGARSESDVYNMLVTHSESRDAKFNLVITPEHVTLSRLSVRYRLIDWILSKHVLVSNYDPDVRFAGECWKDKMGVIHLSRNSGTYRPSEEQLDGAIRYLRDFFPHLTFKKEGA